MKPLRSRIARSAILQLPLLMLLLLVAACAGHAQTPNSQDEDVIRVETDVTNLLFIATDKNNRYITTIEPNDVRVLEDGVPQKFITFERQTDRPLSVALLIDISASEERTLSDEKGAARTFIETILSSRKDEAAVIPFEDYAYLEQPLTSNVIAIYQALERVEVAFPSYLGSGRRLGGLPAGPGVPVPREGSTAIWDAITATSTQILGRTTDQKRRAIILLTDGQDTSSRLHLSEAIKRAVEADTVVYVIGIGDSRQGGVAHSPLNQIADATGGRAFFPGRNGDLTTAFAEIGQELRSQYLIAYSSSNKNRDGSFRQMKIEFTNPELARQQLKLRYRPGYFAKPLTKNSRGS